MQNPSVKSISGLNGTFRTIAGRARLRQAPYRKDCHRALQLDPFRSL
jgi:hypothetical protein